MRTRRLFMRPSARARSGSKDPSITRISLRWNYEDERERRAAFWRESWAGRNWSSWDRRMQYDELLKTGRIRKEKISRAEVRRAIERAERDLRTARKIMPEDWDWGFAVAYNAVL